MAIGTTAAIIGSAVIGAGASMAAANSASRASDRAAAAAGDANAANIALAQEQRARNEALFAQYLGDENMARAYLDALQYGSGSYNPNATGVGGSSGGSLDRISLENYLRQQNPQLAAQWDAWERAGNSRTNGHRTLWGDFVGWMQAENREAVSSAMQQLQSQQTQSQTGGQTITRDYVLQQIANTPLAQFAQQDFDARTDLTEAAYAGANDLADQEYADINAAGDLNYSQLTALAERARTGRLTVAQQNLLQRLTNNAETYAAWDAKAQSEAAKAVDLAFSRGGVTGLTGQTRAGVAQVGQDYALDAYGMRTNLDAAAYDPYYADVNNAEENYWGDYEDATNGRNDVRLDATALRGGRRQSAFDTYSGRRAGDYDQFAGDRINSYSDYVRGLTERADRGYGARTNIASGGQSYADAATRANNANADAQATAAYKRGAVTQQLYGDLSRIAGDAWGAIRSKRNTGTIANPLDPNSPRKTG